MVAGSVLVAADAVDTDAVESVIGRAGAEATVRTLPDLSGLFEELCYDIVDCLVLPLSLTEASAIDVAYGVRGLFPDLPIVVKGLPPAAVPADLSVTAVEADSFTDPAVAEAIATALDTPTESAAGREPSRLETLLLSMFEQFPVHLYAKDTAARHIITSNYARDTASLIGLTDLDYHELPESHRQAAYQDDMDVIQNDEPLLDLEEYTAYIDEHVLTTKVPWQDGADEVVGLVGMTRDITERKRREHAARRQHELLVKVALVAAHEFRNELQIAQGRLEHLDSDAEQVAAVQRSHARLSRIVDKVIALASRERNEREPTTVWLSTISRAVWDTLETTNATLIVGNDARLTVDPESLSLLLQILFSNATEHGGDAVTVTVKATSRGFVISDDGEGIDATPPERVFDAAYTTEGENTGFGLYIARSIAAEHDWTLDIVDPESAAFEVGDIDRLEE